MNYIDYFKHKYLYTNLKKHIGSGIEDYITLVHGTNIDNFEKIIKSGKVSNDLKMRNERMIKIFETSIEEDDKKMVDEQISALQNLNIDKYMNSDLVLNDHKSELTWFQLVNNKYLDYNTYPLSQQTYEEYKIRLVFKIPEKELHKYILCFSDKRLTGSDIKSYYQGVVVSPSDVSLKTYLHSIHIITANMTEIEVSSMTERVIRSCLENSTLTNIICNFVDNKKWQDDIIKQKNLNEKIKHIVENVENKLKTIYENFVISNDEEQAVNLIKHYNVLKNKYVTKMHETLDESTYDSYEKEFDDMIESIINPHSLLLN